jgi:hypothetical protein
MSKYGNALYILRDWVLRNSPKKFQDVSQDARFRIDGSSSAYYEFFVAVDPLVLDVVLLDKNMVGIGIPLRVVNVVGESPNTALDRVALKIKDSFKFINGCDSHMIMYRFDPDRKYMEYLYNSKVSGVNRINNVDVLNLDSFKDFAHLPKIIPFKKYLDAYIK